MFPYRLLRLVRAEFTVVKEILLVLIINVSITISIALPMLVVIYLLMR